jgi:hypothetical protein
MACPSIVAHITKADACSRCGRTLVIYSPNVGVGVFSEVGIAPGQHPFAYLAEIGWCTELS